MALDKTTKNLLIVGGVLAVGGLAYYFITRKGQGTRKIIGFCLTDFGYDAEDGEVIDVMIRQNMSNQQLTDAQKLSSEQGSWSLNYQPNTLPKFDDLGIEVEYDPEALNQRVIDGSKLKITNGGKLNGIYNILWVNLSIERGANFQQKFKGYVSGFTLERGDFGGFEDIRVPHDIKYDICLEYKYGKDMPNWKIIK